ncbi:RNA-directed DNA polymerase [Abeliophyllum distichum]|uniref:RNA-directed DNA polymerase n=1 Tax=Abeliophyllum distichum TaxID=126358 RepID=A0ABD1RC49_9LAMI
MINPDSEELEYSLRFGFPATNNDAEYEAVITGLSIAVRLGLSSVGEYESKDDKMAAYLMKVRDLHRRFSSFKITKVPRKDNTRADALSKLASANPKHLPPTANVQVLHQPSIVNTVEIKEISTKCSWIDSIVDYIVDNKLPDNPAEAKRLKARTAMFTVIDKKLYKRGFSAPYLKCLSPTEAQEVLYEIHSGICGNHQGASALAFKALRQGYYWPDMKEDAKDLGTDRRDPVHALFWDGGSRTSGNLEPNRQNDESAGDLVLRNAAAAGHPPTKLGANWEGPYEVIRSVGKGAYSLKDLKGKPLSRPWNVEHLKQYYQ